MYLKKLNASTLAAIFSSMLCLNIANGDVLQGKASWIGERFQGKKTASGEPFNQDDLTARHATLPFGSKVKVTSTTTGKSTTVRINDRMEIDSGRVIDLSRKAAEQIGLIDEGVGLVKLEVLSEGPGSTSVAAKPSTTTSPSRDKADKVEASPNPKPSAVSTNADGNYQVQFGAFFDLDRAIELREKLKAQNIESTIQDGEKDGKPFYKVLSKSRYSSADKAKCSIVLSDTPIGVAVPVSNTPSTATNSIPKTSSTANSSQSPKPDSQAPNSSYEYGAQFGAFSSLANAKELQTKLLKEKSVKTIVHQFPDDERKLYRVLSEKPFKSKPEVEAYIKNNNLQNAVILTFQAN